MSTIDLAASPSDLRALAEQSNAWPFEQAKAIVARLKKKPKDEVLFETGYGPSGLPHIGTFGEVARTTMVRHAFRVLTEDKIKTRLIAFSDDMDGLRKVPDNVPNKEMLAQHLGKPLTQVPDPFGNASERSARTTMRGCAPSSTLSASTTSSPARPTTTRPAGSTRRCCSVLERYDKVMAIMLPTLREERARDLFAVPADLPAHRRGAAGADRRARRRGRHHLLRRSGDQRARRRRRSPAAIASCNGSRTGRCAGSRSASTTRWPART